MKHKIGYSEPGRVGLGRSPNVLRSLDFSFSRFGSLAKSRYSLFEVRKPVENWLCLCCKEVLCSRFVNRHMLMHHQQTGHCLALSYSDLSVWCFCCEAYLDAQIILQLCFEPPGFLCKLRQQA